MTLAPQRVLGGKVPAFCDHDLVSADHYLAPADHHLARATGLA